MSCREAKASVTGNWTMRFIVKDMLGVGKYDCHFQTFRTYFSVMFALFALILEPFPPRRYGAHTRAVNL